jgi:NADPH-dependent 2,4-dienoyl-CoA reductase/sulfur reductase-like enzyme/two-component sensor histidine kinase/rhodanese-related sulfurtransferase
VRLDDGAGMNDSRDGNVDDYLRLISHELKSPINAIKALLDTVTEGYAGDVDERTRFVIGKASRRASEAQQIISDLIQLQLFDTKSVKEAVNLTDIIRALVEELGLDGTEKGISISSEMPEGTRVFIEGDATGIEHAFRNLIENAVKYTQTGGEVHVTTHVSTDKQSIRIQVRDNGPGISLADQEQLFQPFFRAAAQASKTSGTGLGLAIVQRVIEGHEGSVSVESSPGEGTSFIVDLPLHRIELGEAEQTGRRIVIIGGVTAGPKTAARLRRLDEDLLITIIEQNRFLSYSGCGLPWYISGRVDSPLQLMSSGDGDIRDITFFETIDNIRIMNNTRAEIIDRRAKKVWVKSGREPRRGIPYDVLVLATGARALMPAIEGIDLPGVFRLRSIEDAEGIKREIRGGHAQDLIIVGGGLVGISAAEEILRTGTRITILEKKASILQKFVDIDVAVRVERLLSDRGIKIRTGTEAMRIRRDSNRLFIDTGSETFAGDLIIVSAGVTPNSELASQCDLPVGNSGGIVVDSKMRTTDPSIYAVGDCVESPHVVTDDAEYWPLGSVSTKMGRIAADNICGLNSDYSGSVGSAMFGFRDVSVARTGLTSRAAIKSGFDLETAIVAGKDRAHFDAKANDIALKIIADRKTRVILGAQGFGNGDVVTRIQLFAAAITRKMTLDEFFKLDIGYAPSFNSPIDIAQTGCLVLANKLDELIRTIHPDDLDTLAEDTVFVSLCPASSYMHHEIPGSINIPLERLRRDPFPYDFDRSIVLYSRTSAGAYSGYRYLLAKGYTKLRVLEGGFLFFDAL